MKQIKFYILILLLIIILLSTSYVLAEEVKSLLSDYPYISEIERSIILSEIKEAVNNGVNEYDIESIVELAKKRKISPLGLKDIISLISQAAKLNLYPELLINKAKEGLLKRVREDVIIDVLKKRLDYIRTSKLIIDSLKGEMDSNEREELILIVVQNLENGLSEDVITKLLNYSFSKKAPVDKVRVVLDEISGLPALGITDKAIFKLGEFFFKRDVADIGIEEVINTILLSIKVGVPVDELSEFLSGAYRYKDYVSLRNAILRFARENGKKRGIKKETPTHALPPPPSK